MFQTDFGLVDGAVPSMYGVAYTIEPDLVIRDLTHEIPTYDIWSAAYRLYQSISYWPQKTVFVSVVDPGVGGERKSIVCLTRSDHYIITPDNGTLTFIARYIGIKEVRELNETSSRINDSSESHTFHGRDIYAYNGAKLASDKVSFEALGKEISKDEIVTLRTTSAVKKGNTIFGTIDILDSQYGSLWTNIPNAFIKELNICYQHFLEVAIFHNDTKVYQNLLPFVKSFGEVNVNESLIYINSLLNVAIAVNQDSFSEKYHIGTGNDWKIQLSFSE